MKKIYLTKYLQSAFGKLGDYPVESMIADAGSKELDDIDRNQVDHVAIAGLLAPALSEQQLLGGLVAMPFDTSLRVRGSCRREVSLDAEFWNAVRVARA